MWNPEGGGAKFEQHSGILLQASRPDIGLLSRSELTGQERHQHRYVCSLLRCQPLLARSLPVQGDTCVASIEALVPTLGDHLQGNVEERMYGYLHITTPNIV